MNKVHIHLLALTLAVIGLGIFLYKIVVFQFPLLPEAKARVWQVETKLTFMAKGEPVRRPPLPSLEFRKLQGF